ncbi:MAG: hypothetical protein R3C45_21015 [Phycisphaerales bacterium]
MLFGTFAVKQPGTDNPRMLEEDATALAEQIEKDFGCISEPTDWIWTQPPAPKVIDCVLSLHQKYHTVVEPRVKAFVAENPEVRTCSDLRKLMDASESKASFYAKYLNMKSPSKAATTSDVADYLFDIQKRFDGDTEEDRLLVWARWCRPGDYLSLGVKGFGLAGFQYLRMLFGADTVKPDVHINRYVANSLGQPVSDIRAIYILERAGEILRQPIKSIDVAIWGRGAGHGATP